MCSFEFWFLAHLHNMNCWMNCSYCIHFDFLSLCMYVSRFGSFRLFLLISSANGDTVSTSASVLLAIVCVRVIMVIFFFYSISLKWANAQNSHSVGSLHFDDDTTNYCDYWLHFYSVYNRQKSNCKVLSISFLCLQLIVGGWLIPFISHISFQLFFFIPFYIFVRAFIHFASNSLNSINPLCWLSFRKCSNDLLFMIMLMCCQWRVYTLPMILFTIRTISCCCVSFILLWIFFSPSILWSFQSVMA